MSVPARPPATDPGVPELIDRLRHEIEHDGPITFARFMRRALYEPELGYYATSRDRPTREGDFLTAPELHPIFGRAVSRQVDEMWLRLGEPSDFVVREYGAGRGTLGRALAERYRYEPVESGDEPPARSMVGVVLANEFLDALPVHRVAVEDGRLREVFVGWSHGQFVDQLGELSDSRLTDWFDRRSIKLVEGQRAEVNLAMLDWLAEVAATLERGYVLVFDYGLPAQDLYGPKRLTGTLRAFRFHHVSSDILGGVGRRDLTAHVDLDALADGARAAGLQVIGTTTQAEFLVGVGLSELLEEARALAGEDWAKQLELRASAGRLLDPQHLGGYAAVALSRGVESPTPLRGFGFKLERPNAL
jgi:SAM-dependent MidA family methyltransferase